MNNKLSNIQLTVLRELKHFPFYIFHRSKSILADLQLTPKNLMCYLPSIKRSFVV